MATLSSLLTEISSLSDSSERIARVSELLIGAPYKEHPLIGSSTEEEQFVFSLEEFDCVTYAETCLALAFSANEAMFEENLRLLRYKKGEVTWLTRNHYMSEWIAQNSENGFITRTKLSANPIYIDKELSCLSNYPTCHAHIEMCTPSEFQPEHIHNGDIVLFGSTKPDLDVFHLGILIRQDNDLLLRHASKSLGGVCEELLSHFLARNEVSGLILVRPAKKR